VVVVVVVVVAVVVVVVVVVVVAVAVAVAVAINAQRLPLQLHTHSQIAVAYAMDRFKFRRDLLACRIEHFETMPGVAAVAGADHASEEVPLVTLKLHYRCETCGGAKERQLQNMRRPVCGEVPDSRITEAEICATCSVEMRMPLMQIIAQ